MQTRPKIGVLGSINMDLVVRCQVLPKPGETLIAQSAAEICGGKGANQAVAAARAGAEVHVIGRVGDDSFAERLLTNLRQESIDCRFVSATPESASGLAIVSVDASGENSIVVVPGANGCVNATDVDAAANVIRGSDIMLVQLEVPLETVVAAIQIARDAGTRIILDPAPALSDAPDGLFDVDVICPNESEAATLTGLTLDSDAQLTAAAKQLHERGARNVAITLGQRGALLFNGDSVEIIPSIKVEAVDTTAAGDAFAGSLAVFWVEHGSLRRAVKLANIAGAIAASRCGAQPAMPTRNEILARGTD